MQRAAKHTTKTEGSVVRDKVEREIRAGFAETLNVEVDGKILRLTHLNKVYFPESGIRKRDLLAYYFRVGKLMIPFLKDRPMVLRRYPKEDEKRRFFRKKRRNRFLTRVERATVHSNERGGVIPYVMANDLAAILFLTNLGCIDHNPWSSRSEAQDVPDYVFFDLDPTPGTPFTTVLKIARFILQDPAFDRADLLSENVRRVGIPYFCAVVAEIQLRAHPGICGIGRNE